ncbi:MAG: glutathione S-transferase family protein [Candidatus Comchoanobacterales bacterium]
MGFLQQGIWVDQWYDTQKHQGRFKRTTAQFRNWIESDKLARFPAESGRYHLYVSYACPWAHRTLIYRSLKELDDMIGVSVVDWHMGDQGWTFKPSSPQNGAKDHLYQLNYAHQLYTKADPKYTGRVTVPILWDTQEQTIVSNESADIIRMFNRSFDHLGAAQIDFYPIKQQQAIDGLNELIYQTINNGVYLCGFATSQEAYDEAINPLFNTLDKLNDQLKERRFLLGSRPLEPDWRLFTTLVRFDAVYHTHFKCTHRRLIDYPHLWAYARDLYQWPGIEKTIFMDHICHHYYGSHPMINPNRIVPKMPAMDWLAPHQREHLSR